MKKPSVAVAYLLLLVSVIQVAQRAGADLNEYDWSRSVWRLNPLLYKFDEIFL